MLIQPSHIHFQMIEILRPVTAALGPDAGNRMDHQHLPHRLTLRKTQRQTTKIILHLIIVIPPGILIVENRRIVPLPAASNGIQGKMLTTSRNSKRELPVSQPFLSRKSRSSVIQECHRLYLSDKILQEMLCCTYS